MLFNIDPSRDLHEWHSVARHASRDGHVHGADLLLAGPFVRANDTRHGTHRRPCTCTTAVMCSRFSLLELTAIQNVC